MVGDPVVKELRKLRLIIIAGLLILIPLIGYQTWETRRLRREWMWRNQLYARYGPLKHMFKWSNGQPVPDDYDPPVIAPKKDE